MSIDLSHRPLAAALRQELRHELTALRGNWFWFVLLGVALVVLGTIALGSVAIASLAAAAAIGVLLLLGGVAEAVGAFWCRCWSGFFLELLSGWYCARFPARRRLEGVYQTPDVADRPPARGRPIESAPTRKSTHTASGDSQPRGREAPLQAEQVRGSIVGSQWLQPNIAGEISGHFTAMSLDRQADSQPIEPAIVRETGASFMGRRTCR